MRYAIADVEVTEPLPELRLADDEHGLALLVRRHDRPIHFSFHEHAPGSRIPAAVLERLVAESAGVALLEEAVRQQLAASVPEPAPVSLTVAVCTRARPELLADCLHSLIAVRPDEGDPRRFEILVVDNDPPDGATADVVASLPDVRYAVEPLPGLDFARNRALAEAGTDFVAYLDDDVIVDRGWLAGLEEAVAENPDAAAVTGLVLPYELVSNAQLVFELRGGFGRGFQKLRYAGETLPGNPLYPTGAGIFGAGCNMVLRRDVLVELDGFDEALDTGPPLPGGGDLDIFYRVVRSGHPLVYEPRMLVFHRHRRELEALRRQYWSWGEGFIAYVQKTYRTDPPQRPKLRRLVRWWLGDQLGTLRRSLRGKEPVPPSLVLVELAGGLVGLTGAYRRSRRRVAAIRRSVSG
ncbi:MAG: glycosyltransferase family 2 protein [Gaiellaceae bacterium]